MKKRIAAVILFNSIFMMDILNQTGYANSTTGMQPTYYDFSTKHSYVLCYAIKNDNTLWAWEDYKENDNDYEPVKIADNVKSVSSGYYITTYGELWECGNQIIDNTVKTSLIADGVDKFCDGPWAMYIIKKDKSLWAKGGNNSYGFCLEDQQFKSSDFVKIMNNVQMVSSGGYHTAVLKTDGSLWTFGSNMCGQLGIGSYEDSYKKNKIMDDVKSINAGVLSVFAIKNDDSLWSCGNYGYGGADEDTNRLIPAYYTNDVKQVSARYGYNLVLKNNGELWLYGETETKIYTDMFAVGENRTGFYYPQKIMDNVAEITDELIEADETDIALIVTEDGELFRYNVTRAHGEGTIGIKKVMDGVKLTQEDYISDNTYIAITDSSYQPITALLKVGIFTDMTDTEFMPDKVISRAEAAVLMLRMTGKGNESENCTYTDVTADKWYYGTIGASQKYGIIEGYDDNTFRSDETVSDLQLAVLAARTLRKEGTAVEPDTKQTITVPNNIPAWAVDDITYAIKYGIITEEEAAKLSDENEMTRGEAAVILYRLYNII